MLKFSELKQVPLREIWQHEASDFTPWLIENLLKFKKVFTPEIEHALEILNSSEGEES